MEWWNVVPSLSLRSESLQQSGTSRDMLQDCWNTSAGSVRDPAIWSRLSAVQKIFNYDSETGGGKKKISSAFISGAPTVAAPILSL